MATDGGDRFGAVRTVIEQGIVQHGIPSVAVAVARGGKILWEEGFGWADRENRIPATPHTLYSLASISKPITATGLMILVERGLVDLDRPINDYLGDAKVTARAGKADDATVRRIANHTAGLPLHYQFFYADEPFARPPVDETIRRYGTLVTAPGERYQYSNLGFGLLDHLIARVSGKSYPDFMREEVFVPLGMHHASVDIAPGLAPYTAARYERDGSRYPFYDFDHPGASAVFCSAHDLARFGMFHVKSHRTDQRVILTDAMIDALHTPTVTVDGNIGYGVGWRTTFDNHGYRMVGHSGGMGGVRTMLLIVPTEKIAVAVLTNGGPDSPLFPPLIMDEIFAALLPPYAEERARRKSTSLRENGTTDTEMSFTPEPGLIGEWRGTVHTYLRDLPFTLTFKESGDIHAQLGTQLKTLVNDARLANGYLTGKMMGDIGTPDASRRPHLLHLDFRLRGDTLNGALIAITDHARGTGRLGNALSHRVTLAKEDI